MYQEEEEEEKRDKFPLIVFLPLAMAIILIVFTILFVR